MYFLVLSYFNYNELFVVGGETEEDYAETYICDSNDCRNKIQYNT